jgi:hypothetical protein
MRRVLLAGGSYFLAVFAVAFALGTARVLWLVPRLGELVSVAIEVPIMLTFAWFIARSLRRRFSLSRIDEHLFMGVAAFVILMIVEFLLGVTAFGRSPAEYFAAYRTAAGVLGLVGQCVFAIVPIVQKRLERQ